jgi:hypothetical protein
VESDPIDPEIQKAIEKDLAELDLDWRKDTEEIQQKDNEETHQKFQEDTHEKANEETQEKEGEIEPSERSFSEYKDENEATG